MSKYRIYYYTKVYRVSIIDAENEQEAKDKFYNDCNITTDFIYDDPEIDHIEECEVEVN